MAYKYSDRLISKHGWVFSRDKRSILFAEFARFKEDAILTDKMRADYAAIMTSYLGAVAYDIKFDPADPPSSVTVLTKGSFGEQSLGPIFKYVSNVTWSYIERGSFQLGSPQYYRRVENEGIRDWQEGSIHMFYVSPRKEVAFKSTSGFNCALFCGMSEVHGQDHELMMKRFAGENGGKCLRIDNTVEFAALLKKRTRGFRSRIHDVIYSPVKIMKIESAEVIGRIDKILGPVKQFTDPKEMHQLHRALLRDLFKEFYEDALLPSLFVKPTRYAEERERRLAIELRSDISEVVRVTDKELLDFVKIVDSVGAR
jgi:hypothetical protein